MVKKEKKKTSETELYEIWPLGEEHQVVLSFFLNGNSLNFKEEPIYALETNICQR